MLKRLSLFCLFMIFCLTGFGQVKEIIDKDIILIKYVPDDPIYRSKNWRKITRQNKEYRKRNLEYHEILSLDTLAIPYLVDKISDTTDTFIRIPCSTHALKVGDVAFALLNDIIPIPMHLVTGSQWDVISCDTFELGTWDYLYNDRVKFQVEVKVFFTSPKGKTWVRFIKHKLNKDEYEAAMKQLFNLAPHKFL